MHSRGMSLSRRVLVKYLSVAAGVGVALPRRAALGAAPERLDVKDPTAIALDYVESAAQVDIKKHPGYVSGSNCENCLQLQGSAGDNYRPCSLFPGKLVSVSGWCSGWTPEI